MNGNPTTRRDFLAEIVAYGTAIAVAQQTGSMSALAQGRPDWKSQIGIQLYTVRDVLPADFEGVLAKVAAIGFKEVEAVSYNNMEPKPFRAMLDRCGLKMPSTHAGPSATDPNLEQQFERLQIMGVQYSALSMGGGRGAARGAAPAPAGARAGGQPAAPSGIVRNSFTQAEAFGPNQPRVSLETAKQHAAALNAGGNVARKFGIKMLVHNHTFEFERLLDSDRTYYDVILAETDPAVVTMELDIGWAYTAGVDAIALFEKHPGRFDLWHVKDVFGLKAVNPALSPNERISSMSFVPVGAGQIDYARVFKYTEVAGVKHFFLDHDNAASWGDSLGAAAVSYRALTKVVP